MHSEERRITLARKGEERTRPVAVEVYVSPITSTAVVRFLGSNGSPQMDSDISTLPGHHVSPQDDAVTNGAERLITKRGFTPVSNWTVHRPHTARISIEPTAAYLAYVARRYGPAPEVHAPAGLTVKPTGQHGWWAVEGPGEEYRLTWTTTLDGDRWYLWGSRYYKSAHVAYSRLIACASSPEEALAAIPRTR